MKIRITKHLPNDAIVVFKTKRALLPIPGDVFHVKKVDILCEFRSVFHVDHYTIKKLILLEDEYELLEEKNHEDQNHV